MKIVWNFDFSVHKWSFTRIQPHAFIYVLSKAAHMWQWHSWVAMAETRQTKKPKIFTIWPFSEKKSSAGPLSSGGQIHNRLTTSSKEAWVVSPAVEKESFPDGKQRKVKGRKLMELGEDWMITVYKELPRNLESCSPSCNAMDVLKPQQSTIRPDTELRGDHCL